MFSMVLLTFVDLFITVFNFLLIARVLMSFFASPSNGFYAGLVNITEPVLAPVRQALPKTPGIDWAPLAVFFLLQGLGWLLHSFL